MPFGSDFFSPFGKYSVIPDYNQHLNKRNNQEEATIHSNEEHGNWRLSFWLQTLLKVFKQITQHPSTSIITCKMRIRRVLHWKLPVFIHRKFSLVGRGENYTQPRPPVCPAVWWIHVTSSDQCTVSSSNVSHTQDKAFNC